MDGVDFSFGGVINVVVGVRIVVLFVNDDTGGFEEVGIDNDVDFRGIRGAVVDRLETDESICVGIDGTGKRKDFEIGKHE